MRDIDRSILEALRQDDEELYQHFAAEHTMFHNAMDLFRGRQRWLALAGAFAMIVLLAVAVFTVVRFLQADTVRGMLLWSAAFLLCVVGGTGLKIWAWIEMSKNSIMREIKRIELQMAHLAREVRGAAGSETS
ncbi:MAG: hypothetical protein GF341_06440 [candidate division Zixibacteria bacterium]|nr:hypothetical protein [candidate division Zixibacteria bacterium]